MKENLEEFVDFVYGAQAKTTTMKLPIEILIYTDDSRIDLGGSFGIRQLRRHIDAHQPAFAHINITLVNRNENHHADHLLHDELAKKEYDQIWFFGLHQVNKEPFTMGSGGGGPRSELEKEERDDLAVRMKVGADPRAIGIGVLISGDHANPPPTLQLPPGTSRTCPPNVDHRTYLGLGRALGKHVLRAGEMRKWEGPPTHCDEDSFNTHYLPQGGDLSSSSHQHDENPQPLILVTFDQQGQPSSTGQPHKLFMGRDGRWIKVLPDHEHEGAVELPRSFPIDKWPRNSHFQPRPQIIAYGHDRRTGLQLNILAAYDGDPADVGRIVSDSSWHHFLNVNLSMLSASIPPPSAADQIGQFYSNLAVWLSPRAKRRAMGVEMLHCLANDPMMIEYVGSGALNIGRFALSQVLNVASGCEVQELVIALSPDALRQSTRNFIFKPADQLSSFPSVELLLGSLLHEYFAAVARGEDVKSDQSVLAGLLQRGFESGFFLNASATLGVAEENLYRLLPFSGDSLASKTHLALEALKGLNICEPVATERSNVMNEVEREEWFYDIKLDKNTSEELHCTLFLTREPRCDEIGSDPFELCRVHGELVVSPQERYDVTGSRLHIGSVIVVSLAFPFRRVRLLAIGIHLDEASFTTRFIAHRRGHDVEAAFERVDPDVGDTGTGSGTQTRLERKSG